MKYNSDEYRSFEQERRAAGKLIDPATAEMTWVGRRCSIHMGC
jgi:hypothetical protein